VIIYKIENKINKKIYIGQTKNALNNRVAGHLRNKSFIGNALRKYGLQSFDISVIDSADTKEVLNEKERYWISFYKSEVPNGYNIIQGGSYSTGFSGKRHTKEALQKIKVSSIGKNNGMYGKKHSEETRKKIGDAERGFKHSEESKAKMKVVHLERYRKNPEKWNFSEEAKEKMRKPKSEKGKANIKEAANKPERIQKIKDAWAIRKQKISATG